MRVLITNDDGIDSPGLAALAGVAREQGHDPLVAAPSWDSSGSSAAVTGVTEGRDLLVEPRPWPGWPPGAVLAVQATPALICRSAIEGAFGPPPDLVLSGINRGPNTGQAILHSGTVGAALTAYQQQRPALAISLDVLEGVEVAEGAGVHWGTAARVAGLVADWLSVVAHPVAVNCNVPNVPLGLLRGIKGGRLAMVGTAQSSLTERTGEALALAVDGEQGSNAPGLPEEGGWPPRPPAPPAGEPPTDTELLARGFAALTAVIPIVEDPTVDLAALGLDLHP